jgi:hypothetical protein
MQRFIFKTHDISKLVNSSRPDLAISQMPSSPAMAVSMSLVNKIQTRHLKFEINWAHGSFLDEVPRRLSHSQALAAATEAFMLSTPCAGVSHTLSRRRLRSYTSALYATRLALSHPVEAYSLNTLCAVYLLWICQVCQYSVVRVVVEGFKVTYHRTGRTRKRIQVSILWVWLCCSTNLFVSMLYTHLTEELYTQHVRSLYVQSHYIRLHFLISPINRADLGEHHARYDEH